VLLCAALGCSVLLFAAMPREGWAFSCVRQDIKKSYDASDTVFYGKVIKSQNSSVKNQKEVSFSISNLWKGSIQGDHVIKMPVGDDGYFSRNPFKQDKHYIVFWKKNEEDDQKHSERVFNPCEGYLEILPQDSDFISNFIEYAGQGKAVYANQSRGKTTIHQKPYRLE
jgi:hypothetical protein